MSKWYGSLQNRLEEGKNYAGEITVGTGVTEYMWSDRHPYEVVSVIDQKHVVVRSLDHVLAGVPMSNDWELVSNPENPERRLVKRGKYWYWECTVRAEDIAGIIDGDTILDMQAYLALTVNMSFDPELILRNGKQTKRQKANVSFGVARYYYDYEF